METIGTPLQWGFFLALVLAMLALDLGVVQPQGAPGRPPGGASSGASSGRSSRFSSMSGSTAAVRAQRRARVPHRLPHRAVALSFDNIFVFIVIFNYFAVPAEYQHRVLFWGILGALISRGIFIAWARPCSPRFDW